MNETEIKRAMAPLIGNLPELLLDMIKGGIDFKITQTGIVVDGFYKSGTITLVPNLSEDGAIECRMSWTAIDRYGKESTVVTFSDLVSLNAEWWERSWERMPGGWGIEEKWKPHLVAAGFAEEQTKCVPARK
jgi:hypothetical protein